MNLSEPLRVYVQGDASSAHTRRILEGFAEYTHALPQPWVVRWGLDLPPLASLRRQGYGGLVLFSLPSKRLPELRRSSLSVVRVSSVCPARGLSHVIPDNRAIGELAARHFLDRHYSSFAFVGCEEHDYSRGRLAGFREALCNREVRCFSCNRRTDHRMPGFLARLPDRTAIFTANDIFARIVAETVGKLGLRIPEDRSLLGVDNDPLISLSHTVPLSSIDPASMEIGRRAAGLLARLMAGERNLGSTELVPPAGVVLRASSDHLATTDDLVNRAIRIIRREACSGLTVGDLCGRLGIGRRVFERRFRGVLGKTLESEMRRERIERARELLLSTTLSTERIAEQAGFSDPFYFSAAFRRATGLSPRAWRNSQAQGTKAALPTAGRRAGARIGVVR